jgi:hypothetical protein
MASSALAAPSAGDKCAASKNKAVGAYYSCREKAAATALTKGGSPDYSKCSTKFLEKWSAADTTGGSSCLDTVMTPEDMDAYVAAQANTAAGIVGGSAMPKCGDGAVNVASEHCDGAALDGYTCSSFGMYGTLACTAGCDFDLSACTPCPGSTVPFRGACWVLGAVEASCNTACSGAGLVYDTKTASIAGSGGTDADCTALLDAFATPGGTLDYPSATCTNGLGCGSLPMGGARARCASPATDATSTGPNIQRVCACK